MMSKKKFFVLVVIYVGYMLIGALIFYKIEVPVEIARREVEREERREIEGEGVMRFGFGASDGGPEITRIKCGV